MTDPEFARHQIQIEISADEQIWWPVPGAAFDSWTEHLPPREWAQMVMRLIQNEVVHLVMNGPTGRFSAHIRRRLDS